jgi:hypothetical protein
MLIKTDDDWKKIEDMLTPYRSVKLVIDGWNVLVTMPIINKKRVEIFLYINGKFDPRWITHDCEIRWKFMYSYKKYVYRRKTRIELIKLAKKAGKIGIDLDFNQKITVYKPFFPSFRALKKHLQTYNEEIELVENG